MPLYCQSSFPLLCLSASWLFSTFFMGVLGHGTIACHPLFYFCIILLPFCCIALVFLVLPSEFPDYSLQPSPLKFWQSSYIHLCFLLSCVSAISTPFVLSFKSKGDCNSFTVFDDIGLKDNISNSDLFSTLCNKLTASSYLCSLS